MDGPPGVLAEGDAGFLVRAAERGQAAAETLRGGLERLNPDAVRAPARFGTLSALVGAAEAPRPVVAVGVHDGEWLVWGASAEACTACLSELVAGSEAPRGGADAVQAGALAALLFQRLVLGVAPPLSGVRVGPQGALEVLKAPACSHGRDVPSIVLAEAVRHLETRYPDEGCGVVLEGPAGMRWVPMANAYAAWSARDPLAFPRSPRTAFLFEPSEWLRLLKQADVHGERVAYVVHAHPDGQAAFSKEDTAQAAPDGLPLLPGVDYIVVAVRKGRAVAATKARWTEGRFLEEPLLLAGLAEPVAAVR